MINFFSWQEYLLKLRWSQVNLRSSQDVFLLLSGHIWSIFIPLFFLSIVCTVRTSGDFGTLLETLVSYNSWIIAPVRKQTYILALWQFFFMKIFTWQMFVQFNHFQSVLWKAILSPSLHLFTLIFGFKSSFLPFYFGCRALISFVVVWKSCCILSSSKTTSVQDRV